MIGLGTIFVASAGAVGTIVAVTLLPWARYGGIDIKVVDLPNWGFYVSTVAILHLCVIWVLVASARRSRGWSVWLPRAITPIFGAAAVVSAIVVLSHYRNAEALFGSVVPPIAPVLGWGGPVAVAAILVSAGVMLIPSQHADSTRHE